MDINYKYYFYFLVYQKHYKIIMYIKCIILKYLIKNLDF